MAWQESNFSLLFRSHYLFNMMLPSQPQMNSKQLYSNTYRENGLNIYWIPWNIRHVFDLLLFVVLSIPVGSLGLMYPYQYFHVTLMAPGRWLLNNRLRDLEWYGRNEIKIYITTTNHSKCRIVCTLHGMYRLCINAGSISMGSLWLRQIIGSSWVQVMACCLTATGHYLNHCWHPIIEVLWHSSQGSFTETAQTNILHNEF